LLEEASREEEPRLRPWADIAAVVASGVVIVRLLPSGHESQ
jgi:hypothetical protein